MINCKEATLLSEKKHEGAISLGERFSLWLHMSFCAICKTFQVQSHWISEQARKLPSNERLQPEEKKVIREHLQKELGKENR